jgi:peptidoglycan/LPS O-acetylase OafA/YrhL
MGADNRRLSAHDDRVLGGWRLGRRPGLDGLRAVAVLLVVGSHVVHTLSGHAALSGSAGVMVFFALSGFLITAILMEGQEFATFYRNRLLRLAPALVVFVVVAGVIQQGVTGIPAVRNWPALLYLANWMSLPGPWFGHIWTLAVEEQFYMVWPVALVLSRRWRYGPLALCLGGMAASLACKLVLFDGGAGSSRIYVGSDTEAWALLSGCLVAVLAHHGLSPVRVRGLAPVTAVGLFGLCLAPATPTAAGLVVPLVVPVLAALLIWVVCSTPSRLLEVPALRYVGRRSYALYLWHPACLAIAVLALGPSVAAVALGLSLAVMAAEASWRCVESPFLRRKARATEPSVAVDEDVVIVEGRRRLAWTAGLARAPSGAAVT